MYDLEKLHRSASSRRGFLKVMAAAGLGLAAETLLSGKGYAATNASPSFSSPDFPGIPRCEQSTKSC